MSGVLGMLLAGGSRLATTVTVGNDGSSYGYENFAGFFGAIGLGTFGSQTIAAITWTISASGAISFRLSGTSIADSNATFTAIFINGVVFQRSAASYTANDGNGNTLWTWGVDTSSYPTSGSVVFQVI